MKIAKVTDYALRAMVELVDSEELLSAAELSKRVGISDKMMRGVLNKLRNGGFLESVQGMNGGYRIAGSPREITVYDVMKATERTMLVYPSIEKAPERGINRYYISIQNKIDRMHKDVTLHKLRSIAK
jgi:Rrf2 family protein